MATTIDTTLDGWDRDGIPCYRDDKYTIDIYICDSKTIRIFDIHKGIDFYVIKAQDTFPPISRAHKYPIHMTFSYTADEVVHTLSTHPVISVNIDNNVNDNNVNDNNEIVKCLQRQNELLTTLVTSLTSLTLSLTEKLDKHDHLLHQIANNTNRGY